MRAVLRGWVVLLLPTTLSGQELEPCKSNRHSTDVPKRHVPTLTIRADTLATSIRRQPFRDGTQGLCEALECVTITGSLQGKNDLMKDLLNILGRKFVRY